MKLFIIFGHVCLALQSHDVSFSERTMWRFGSSYDVLASLSFIFLGLVDMSSHRKHAPHHWLGKMVHLCTQDCSDPLLSLRTLGLPVPRLLTN